MAKMVVSYSNGQCRHFLVMGTVYLRENLGLGVGLFALGLGNAAGEKILYCFPKDLQFNHNVCLHKQLGAGLASALPFLYVC